MPTPVMLFPPADAVSGGTIDGVMAQVTLIPMSAFLPMFIGGIFGQYSSYPIAIFMGAVVQAIITSGLQGMGVPNSVQTVINGLIVRAFLIYDSNSYKLVEMQMFKEKPAQAKAAR